MKKTMYIPKWQESRFENLTCDRIVLNGSLHVDGRLKTKHISGKGFLYAKWITATSITANTVDADTIATDTLAASHVYAYDVHAVRSMEVSSLINANYVKTGHITYCDSEILNLEAGEAVKLAPKRRGLLRTLFASLIRTTWAELFSARPLIRHGFDDENADSIQSSFTQEATQIQTQAEAIGADEKADAMPPELEEAARLINDPEFLRLKALYRLTRETGDIWQIVPKAEQTDRAVAPAYPFIMQDSNVA